MSSTVKAELADCARVFNGNADKANRITVASAAILRGFDGLSMVIFSD